MQLIQELQQRHEQEVAALLKEKDQQLQDQQQALKECQRQTQQLKTKQVSFLSFSRCRS